MVALDNDTELRLHRRVHRSTQTVAAAFFEPRFGGCHERIMNGFGVTLIGNFIEAKKAKFVFIEVVVQIVLYRDDPADWLIL